MKKIALYLVIVSMFISCSQDNEFVENQLENTETTWNSLKISDSEQELLARQGISLHQVIVEGETPETVLAFESREFMEELAQNEESLEKLTQIQKANAMVTFADMEAQNSAEGRTEGDNKHQIESDFLARLLNQDGVLQIGKWLFRIDKPNEAVYVLPVEKKRLYRKLIQEVPNHPQIMVFSTEYEVLTLLEDGVMGTPSNGRVELFCGDKRASAKNEEAVTPDEDYEFRIKGTHAYRKYGVYFELYATARLQRLSQPFSLWVDAWGDIAVNTGGLSQHRCKPSVGSIGGGSQRNDCKVRVTLHSSTKNLRGYALGSTMSYNDGNRTYIARPKAISSNL